MSELEKYSIEELKREIEEREEKTRYDKIPPFLSEQEIINNLHKLKEVVMNQIKGIIDECCDELDDTYISEAALTALFGDKIFDFINNGMGVYDDD